jgi:hypothetical protein
MTVEQAVITQTPGTKEFSISDRIRLACELVEPADGPLLRVRLLEAGAGLPVGHEMTVHASKVGL